MMYEPTSMDPPENQEFLVSGVKYFAKSELENMLLQKQAISHQMETSRYSPVLFKARLPGQMPELGFKFNGSNYTSVWGKTICSNKQLTVQVLTDAGIRVPSGRPFRYSDFDSAWRYAAGFNGKFVVKPLDGSGGKGVSAGLQNHDEFLAAHRLLAKSDYFRVERHVEGFDYRLLTSDRNVISILKRVPAHVDGDGRTSIRDLIEAKNIARARHPRYSRSPILIEHPETIRLIRDSSLTLDSTLPTGRRLMLAVAANVSRGGECHEVLHEADPSIIRLAIAAWEAIGGLGHCGIDLLAPDHRKPLDRQDYAICEVNSHAELFVHCFPSSGKPINAVAEVFRLTATRLGIHLPPVSTHTRNRFFLATFDRSDQLVRAVSMFAEIMGVLIAEVQRGDDGLSFVAEGSAGGIAALSAKAVALHPTLRVESVKTTPIS